jgi:hypothetical protein
MNSTSRLRLRLRVNRAHLNAADRDTYCGRSFGCKRSSFIRRREFHAIASNF